MTRGRALLATMFFTTATLSWAAVPPAGAQVSGPCTATINGQDVATATSPAKAIEVAHDDTIVVSGTDSTGAPYTKIKLRFPPLPDVTVYDEPNDGGETWGGSVDVKDYATWGVGLYQVSGGTDDCTGKAWIKVTGKSPFTTVASGVGLGLGAVGAVGAARGLRRAKPGFGSLLRTALGVAPLGLGAAIVAQQLAITPLTGVTVVAYTAGTAALGGLANLALGAAKVGAAATV
jgi:hypothetical protein